MWSKAGIRENPSVSQKAKLIITSHGHERDWYLFVIHNFMDIDGGLSVFT